MANDKQLIDANDVYSLFDRSGFARMHLSDIDTIPRVDAVEVVRCRDCKKYREPICLIDDTQSGYLTVVPPEHYCSYGERKEGADND